MTILGTTSTEICEVMGVKRQAVDKWLLTGPSSDRVAKIGVITEIADILRYRLRNGMPPGVVHRPAAADANRSIPELVTADEHDWLLAGVRLLPCGVNVVVVEISGRFFRVADPDWSNPSANGASALPALTATLVARTQLVSRFIH